MICLIIAGTVTVTDPDGDTPAFSLATGPTKGTVVLHDDGTFTYTPDPTARHTAAAETADPTDLSDTFTLAVNDGHGGSTLVTVNVTVTGANTAPTGTANPATPDTNGIIAGTVTVTDPDGDTLTYSAPTTSNSGGATVTIDPSTGEFTYTPTDAARHAAAADGADTTDTFDITVTDGHGGLTTLSVNVTITGANTAPTGTANPATPDTNGIIAGTVTVTDPDGDTVTQSLTAAAAHGIVQFNPTSGTFTYTPTDAARHAAAADGAPAEALTDTFTITISDGHGGAAQIPVTVAIAPANTPPTGAATLGAADSVGSIAGATNGTDADSDTLRFSAPATSDKGGNVIIDADTGAFTYTPTYAARHAAAAYGATSADLADNFTITVEDGHGGTATIAVTVPVVSANDIPTAVVTIGNLDATGHLIGSVAATDTDGDALIYTAPTTRSRSATDTVEWSLCRSPSS